MLRFAARHLPLLLVPGLLLGGCRANEAPDEAAPAATSPEVTTSVVTDLARLARGGADLSDREVELKNVTVQEAVTAFSFWAGNDAERLFVVVSRLALPAGTRLQTGERWDLKGIVRPVPTGRDLTAWRLPEEALPQLRGEKIYLQAIRATPAGD